jgi:ribosome biogenesis GTPase
MDQLSRFGWSDDFYQKWMLLRAEGLQPARVIADFGTSLKIAMPDIHTAELTGKLAHYSNREATPKVGDWVTVRLSDNGHAVIEGIIPRRSEIARKVTGKRTVKQVIAANVDVAFVLLALDNDFSVKRLERFLYQLSADGIKPVIVLNKADKTDDVKFYTDQLETFDLPVIITAATTGSGVDEMLHFIPPENTAILLGSSGVGKSTLTNRLLGRDAQNTQPVRSSDATGKHTTVHRELFILPNKGLLIDTPGVRELQLWGTPDDLDENFDDIAALASQCKYTTCRHGTEPGCAIQEALRTGALDPSRFASYLKLKDELIGLKTKNDIQIRRSNEKSHKSLAHQTKDALKEMREDTEELHKKE